MSDPFTILLSSIIDTYSWRKVTAHAILVSPAYSPTCPMMHFLFRVSTQTADSETLCL